MKKLIIISVAALSALFSCTKFENDTADSPLAVPSIDVTISAVGDSTFTFTVTPGTGTGYYSYTVLKGDAKYLDSTKVLGVSCKGIAEATQTMEAKPTVTVTLGVKDGILPNTTYTVYAVAANVQSLVSGVKSVTVVTTDFNIPAPASATVSATSAGATISFNETVLRPAEKAGKVYAHYYKVWAPESEAFTLELGEKDIVVSGSKVTLSAPDTVAGAYVLFTWEEGMVQNAVGTKCEPFLYNKFVAKDGEIVKTKCEGLVTRWPVGTFGWTRVCMDSEGKVMTCPEDSVLAFFDPVDAMYLVKSDSVIVSVKDAEIALTYKNSKTETTYKDYYSVSSWGVSGGEVLCLPAMAGYDPDFGDCLNFSVAEESFQDVWGNTSEEYENEDNYLRSYGYTVDDFCGTYDMYCFSYDGGYYTDNVVIEKVDSDTVTLSGLGVNNPLLNPFTPSTNKLKAVVDCVFGTMSILPDASCGTTPYKGADLDISLAGGDWVDELTNVKFFMSTKGTFTSEYSYFYWVASSEGSILGYWDVSYPLSFTVSAGPSSCNMKQMSFDKTISGSHKSLR